MLIKKSFTVFTVLTLFLLVSCNDANFSGSAKKRAKYTTLLPGTLTCAVQPTQVNLEESVQIVLSNSAEVKVDLIQNVIFADNNIGSNLTFNGENYVVEGGGANTFVGSVAGNYTVELRLAESTEASASCEFLVIDPNGPQPTPTPTGPTPNPTPTGSPPPSPTPTPPLCPEGEESLGAHVAFVIDNSNSNAATDCQNPEKIGEFSGSTLYQCQGETNREKAVLSAFDTLKAVADNESENADARSQMAVASFPTQQKFVDGWEIQGQGFVQVTDTRDQVSSLLGFTRKPFGLTPYGAAMTAATELFTGIPEDGKAKVAVLVTDGEPTDRDPGAVAAQATALKAMGVEVYSVYVTQAQSRGERRATHTEMMERINQSTINSTGSNWFADTFSDFSGYIQALIGGGNSPALVDQVSNRVIEVENSEALTAAFQEIIRSRALSCQEIQ